MMTELRKKQFIGVYDHDKTVSSLIRRYIAGPAGTAVVDIVGSLELLQSTKAIGDNESARSKDTRKVCKLRSWSSAV